MALCTQKLRDAFGQVATYRTNSASPDRATGHPEPPEHPHPDELLRVRFSGYFIPANCRRPLADIAAYYAAHPESEGHPISGDECARVRHMRCGDPQPDPHTGCRGPEHCQVAPHEPGSGWLSERHPHYRDIAHALYPAGRVPQPLPAQPIQLDLLAFLGTIFDEPLDHA